MGIVMYLEKTQFMSKRTFKINFYFLVKIFPTLGRKI